MCTVSQYNVLNLVYKVIRMETDLIEYSIERMSVVCIENFLKKVDYLFIPKLSQTLDILKYAEKLSENAICFIASDNDQPVAFLAAYFNDKSFKTGYITMFATIESYQHKGIGTKLIENTIAYASEFKFQHIVLESELHQVPFYQKRGFEIIEKKPKSYMMKYQLKI